LSLFRCFVVVKKDLGELDLFDLVFSVFSDTWYLFLIGAYLLSFGFICWMVAFKFRYLLLVPFVWWLLVLIFICLSEFTFGGFLSLDNFYCMDNFGVYLCRSQGWISLYPNSSTTTFCALTYEHNIEEEQCIPTLEHLSFG
jgi:hypothetical protein